MTPPTRRCLLAGLTVLASLAPAAGAGASQLITITTPSVNVDPATTVFNGPRPTELRANVLLPDGYDPARRYRVLFLLHGIGDTYASWSQPSKGDIANTARGLNAIVVMPEAGRGFYANWFNGGLRGRPGWERFYLDELIAQIRARFPIMPGRANHAIAGLSMGGLGATFLAGQRPDFFGSSAAFSGFVSHQRPEVAVGLAALGGPMYTDVFGPMDGAYATGHNPTRLIDNLRATRLYVAAGNGIVKPGVSSAPATIVAGGAVEAALRVQNDELVQAARSAGVDVTYRPQLGIHDWPYWREHLRDAIRWGLFRGVAEHPRRWTYRTIASTGRMWDLRYDFATPPPEVVAFARDGRRLRGTGTGVVTLRTTRGCAFTVTLPFERRVPRRRCTAG